MVTNSGKSSVDLRTLATVAFLCFIGTFIFAALVLQTSAASEAHSNLAKITQKLGATPSIIRVDFKRAIQVLRGDQNVDLTAAIGGATTIAKLGAFFTAAMFANVYSVKPSATSKDLKTFYEYINLPTVTQLNLGSNASPEFLEASRRFHKCYA